MKTGKYLIIIIFSTVIVGVFLCKYGVFDFFNLRQNSIAINVEVEKDNARDLKVLLVSEYADTTILYELGKHLIEKTDDWYGKDHISVINLCGEVICSFPTFKLKSYEKVDGILRIRQIGGNLLVTWNLATLSLKAKGKSNLPIKCSTGLTRKVEEI